MLGWFKKKFGRKTQEEPVGEPLEQEIAQQPGAEEGREEQVVQVVEEPESIGKPEPEREHVQEQEEAAQISDVDSAQEEITPLAREEEGGEQHERVSPESDVAETVEDPELDMGEPVDAEADEVESFPESEERESEGEKDLEAELEQEPEPAAPPQEVQQQGEGALETEQEQQPQAQHKEGSLFKRLQDRLGKTRDSFVYRMDSLLLGKKEIDQELFDELEELLITADLGVETSMDLLEYARKTVKREKLSDPASLKGVLKQRILEYIKASDQPAELVMPAKGPFVIMVVGVNGVGKTTTIGKIANKFVHADQSVLLVAGDTFRAAAIDQLKIWGDRVGVEVVAQKPGSDPSSVVFDGMEYGIAHKYDVIIIDTAGRLHTSVNLMEELKKIKRVIGKKLASAPHEVMLVIDATTGQNGISQAQLFDAAVDITGLSLSKLDGTAKGGIVANICREMKIPVRFIGIGEQMDDLRDFDSSEFVDALFADTAESK
ncbi:MAG: signal recognition particle-docking protein FtsY [Desulfobulbus propionicus]|nr:MAG: signal recognition particle-docking protein FtsY [Desulfobulbus propionicus]PIE65524.1 MAG: signal recognition particle-docking protein FtsY [Desulfobacterales bacterium]